jgi:hypothetical protein
MDYAATAERYWRTYLPSQYAKIAPADRATFFTSLGEQVDTMVTYLTEDNLRAVSRPTDTPDLRARRENMARAKAEQEALAELVQLPKEPGTEDRELPLPASLTST